MSTTNHYTCHYSKSGNLIAKCFGFHSFRVDAAEIDGWLAYIHKQGHTFSFPKGETRPTPKTPSINATIKHLGVKLLAARCGRRYLGYSYFVSLKDGNQVGDSVLVYRQNQLSLDRWLREAQEAINKK